MDEHCPECSPGGHQCACCGADFEIVEQPLTITRAQVEEAVKAGAREGQFYTSYTIAARTAALNALKAAHVEVVEDQT